MESRFEVITFDCYGTLVDWEAGISGAFRKLGERIGVETPTSEVLRLYAHIEPQVQAAGYRSYREVVDTTAHRVAETMGFELPADRREFLSRSLGGWPPFGDTNPALEALVAAGFGLGILSNVDDDLLAQTLRHLTPRFDPLVTAQQVGSYKPAHGHFLRAREAVAGRSWLHVAQSRYHDVAPALELGIPVVWINRKAEPAAAALRPLAEYSDLAAFSRSLLAG